MSFVCCYFCIRHDFIILPLPKCPLYVKYVLALPWKIWSDRLSRQHSTYTSKYCVDCAICHFKFTFNKSLNSHKHNWQLCFKIVKHIVIHIIFIAHARNVCLQHEGEHANAGITSPMTRSIRNVIHTCQLVLDASFQFDIWDLGTRWTMTFRAYYVKMMWLTARLMIFETVTANRVRGYSMIH